MSNLFVVEAIDIESDYDKSNDIEEIEFETVDEVEVVEETVPRKKSKKYERFFKSSWEYDKRFSNWLIRSPNNLPFCKFCGTELKASGGTQDLKYHMKTRKHIRNSENMNRHVIDETEDNCHNIATTEEYFNDNNSLDEKSTKSAVGKYENFCKVCGDSLSNVDNNIDSNNKEKLSTVFEKVINIEEEKKKIQLEMKELMESLESDKEIIVTRTPVQAFSNMLTSDMSKLPDSIQRKLRINIMHQVDVELLKLETS